MKSPNTSIWIIIVSVCVSMVLGCVALSTGNNGEGKNTSSPSVPAKSTDLSEEQIFLQMLQEFRKNWKPQMSHGPMKDGLAAFLICERKQFKVGEPIPVMIGIVYGKYEGHMTVYQPLHPIDPCNCSWFSATGPDGKDVPYTGGNLDFFGLDPKGAKRLHRGLFCGRVCNDVRHSYKLDTPGSYTIEWHYEISPALGGSWWHGYLGSNKIQIEIVK
jgi:hypothetical protein